MENIALYAEIAKFTVIAAGLLIGLGASSIGHLPEGYVQNAPVTRDYVAAIRAAGGIVIADEVQPGFGRAGSHFWGHEKLGFAPDVVVMGKPMANGHPVGAVATRPDVMAVSHHHAASVITIPVGDRPES